MNKTGKKGLARLIAATGYALKGLKAAWKYEEAFRLEVCLCLIFIPLAFVIAADISHLLILLTSCGLILIAELINSAVEAIVDRVSVERHPLSGQAKDIGSAAVLVAVGLFILIWSISLIRLI